MRTLQGPGRDNEPDPFASLAKQLADLRRQIDDATAQVLRMAGLRAEPDLLRVLGSLVVEGGLSVPSGKITLAGVDQDLATAMANITTLVGQQVATDCGTAAQTADLTTTEASYASVTIPVPSGFSRAQVSGVCSLYCSGGTYAYLRCQIAGENGQVMYALGAGGATGAATAPHVKKLTALSGGSITIQARANTAASTVTAVMVTAASVTFLR